MKKLILASVAALALSCSAASAAIIQNLGVNPASAQGAFENSVGGTTFTDEYTFQLLGASQFITFSSATNVYAGPEDFITGFTGQLFTAGGTAVAPPVLAEGCPGTPVGCQILAGSALLDAGSYFLRLTGTGGGSSGYGGNLTTIGVVPIPGMALALPFGALGFAWMARRRRQSAPVAA